MGGKRDTNSVFGVFVYTGEKNENLWDGPGSGIIDPLIYLYIFPLFSTSLSLLISVHYHE